MTRSDDTLVEPVEGEHSARLDRLDEQLRLPRPPGVFRRWLAAHPRFVDWFIVGWYLFGCASMVAFELIGVFAATNIPDLAPEAEEQLQSFASYQGWQWGVVRLLITAVVTVALLYRRRAPLAGVIVVSSLMLLEQGMLAVPNSVAVVFLLYAVPVYRSVLAGWVAFACAVLLNTTSLLFAGSYGTALISPAGVLASGPIDWREAITISIVNAVWLLAVLMIGINLGNRRRYVDALIDRAHQLAREREQKAQLAAAAERARIAREMHDIVAHSLSVVVTLSEAASVSIEARPEAAKQAMQRAAETGRDALTEMRRLLGVLREPSAESGQQEGNLEPGQSHAPQPGLGQLQELVDGFREAGLEVSISEAGVPQGDQSHQLTLYRIVQEALTNSLRHAGVGAAVSVTLEHEAALTTIEVVDGGAARGSAGARPIVGSGLGLEGARQRALIFGGSLEAGPQGSGWRVSARVPTQHRGEERQ